MASCDSRFSPHSCSGRVATFAGCESKGPAQQAGENIDKGIQNTKDTINPPGSAEKAGRSFDN